MTLSSEWNPTVPVASFLERSVNLFKKTVCDSPRNQCFQLSEPLSKCESYRVWWQTRKVWKADATAVRRTSVATDPMLFHSWHGYFRVLKLGIPAFLPSQIDG